MVETMVGEVDGKSFESAINFFIPRNRPEVSNLLASMANDRFIALIKDGADQVNIVGSIERPLHLEENTADRGTAIADRNGTQWMLKVSAGNPAYYYEGAIVTA